MFFFFFLINLVSLFCFFFFFFSSSLYILIFLDYEKNFFLKEHTKGSFEFEILKSADFKIGNFT